MISSEDGYIEQFRCHNGLVIIGGPTGCWIRGTAGCTWRWNHVTDTWDSCILLDLTTQHLLQFDAAVSLAKALDPPMGYRQYNPWHA